MARRTKIELGTPVEELPEWSVSFDYVEEKKEEEVKHTERQQQPTQKQTPTSALDSGFVAEFVLDGDITSKEDKNSSVLQDDFEASNTMLDYAHFDTNGNSAGGISEGMISNQPVSDLDENQLLAENPQENNSLLSENVIEENTIQAWDGVGVESFPEESVQKESNLVAEEEPMTEIEPEEVETEEEEPIIEPVEVETEEEETIIEPVKAETEEEEPILEPVKVETEEEEPIIEPVEVETEEEEPIIEPVKVETEEEEPILEPVKVETEEAEPIIEPVEAETEEEEPIIEPEEVTEKLIDEVEEKLCDLVNSMQDWEQSENALSEAAAMLSSEEKAASRILEEQDEDKELTNLLERLDISDELNRMHATVQKDMAEVSGQWDSLTENDSEPEEQFPEPEMKAGEPEEQLPEPEMKETEEEEPKSQTESSGVLSNFEISNEMFDMGMDVSEEQDYSEENIDLSAFRGSIKDAEEINAQLDHQINLDDQMNNPKGAADFDMSNLVAAALNDLSKRSAGEDDLEDETEAILENPEETKHSLEPDSLSISANLETKDMDEMQNSEVEESEIEDMEVEDSESHLEFLTQDEEDDDADDVSLNMLNLVQNENLFEEGKNESEESGELEFLTGVDAQGESEVPTVSGLFGNLEETGEPNLAGEPELADETDLVGEPDFADEPDLTDEPDVLANPDLVSNESVDVPPEEPVKLVFEPAFPGAENLVDIGDYGFGQGDSLIIEDYVEAPLASEAEEKSKKPEKEKKRFLGRKPRHQTGESSSMQDDLEKSSVGGQVQGEKPEFVLNDSVKQQLLQEENNKHEQEKAGFIQTEAKKTMAPENMLVVGKQVIHKDGKHKRTYFRLTYQ